MRTFVKSVLAKTPVGRRIARVVLNNSDDPEVLQMCLEHLGRRVNRKPNLDNMPWDLPITEPLQFEHLAGLFTSTQMEHGVIAMPARQTAYLYWLVKETKPKKVIEVGRYKGGSTLVIAAAMNREGQFWSLDIGEKEARLHRTQGIRPFDEQLADILQRFHLKADLIVGDSRTVELNTGEVDLVFIDGDHSYDGVKNDFERFGRRVRLGGAVLFDDAFDEEWFKTHADTVGRLVKEALAEGEFRLVKQVNRLAHIERIRPARSANGNVSR